MGENENARMRVVVRIRPINQGELKNEEETILEQLDEKALVFDPANEDEEEHLRDFHKVAKLAEKKSNRGMRRKRNTTYCFDSVFGPDSTQEQVYQETTADTVETVFSGYNCSVFAYGATGAGKTHTMLGTPEDPGVIARTVKALYEKIDLMKEKNNDSLYDVSVQYLEVYNEKINDLLTDGAKGKDLPLREAGGEITISRLTKLVPKDASELMNMLSDGNSRRTQHPTDANAQSSRSHAVFMVSLTCKQGSQIVKSKLTLVDLAGSERATATTNMGKRLQEGGNINRSLLALGNVINALADPKHKGHIKYRDSKLTRLLKDSLGGTCRTVMIANVSPAQSVYEDTLNTIKYADRAKSIRSDLKKRVIERNLHVGKYKEIITNQKKRIQSLEEEIQDMKKQRPKKKDDEINPIWETLLKVIFDVTRLKGDIRNTRLDKFLKEAQFDRKQSVCAIDDSPGTNRNERVLSSFDAKQNRLQDQVDNLEKQVKSLAPSEAAPALINWRRCAEHHQQRSKAYEDQIAKLYSAVNEQNDIIKKLAGATGEQPAVKDILNPAELSVKFTSNEPATEIIPDFLQIPIGEEADLLRPLSASHNGSDKSARAPKAVTRSALKKSSKSAFRTARRPLNFGSVRTPESGETRGRTITKSRSETKLKDQKLEVRPRSQETRPRSASRTKVKTPLSPEERLIPPSQRRKRKSNQDDCDSESEKENDQSSPEQKKQKYVPSYMQPTAISKRRNDIAKLKEMKKKPNSNEARIQALRERIRK